MPDVMAELIMLAVGLILLSIVIELIAQQHWESRALSKAWDLFSRAPEDDPGVVQERELEGLPDCVKKWLRRSGVIGQARIHQVKLIQSGRMRTAPDKPWLPFEAVHYVNVDHPGFVWKARVKLAPGIHMLALDHYYQGHGFMNIKLLGIIPLVNAKPGPEMDQSTMLRYLAELIWYPTAALNSYIHWEEIDQHSARAVMSWQGITAGMVLNFDEAGDLRSSLGQRYQEIDGRYVLTDWGGIARGYADFQGLRIINQTDVVWKLSSGDFNWMQVEVTELEYNRPGK